jgi:hypothetical protein
MLEIFLVSLLALFSNPASSGLPDSLSKKNIRYKTYIGECPSRSAGSFAMTVMKEFEKNHSLKDVKDKILSEKLDEKHFLSNYRVNYNPVIRTLKIDLNCPEPLLRIQVYKSNGEEHYSAILADNSKIYEPGFENLMRTEKKLKHNLPALAISPQQLEGEVSNNLVKFIKEMNIGLRNQISEIIVSKNNDLTIVFALSGRATSVFLGSDQWDEKLLKLTKVVAYVQKSKRYPGSINLVNSKKVVVKFSDNL